MSTQTVVASSKDEEMRVTHTYNTIGSSNIFIEKGKYTITFIGSDYKSKARELASLILKVCD